MPLNTKSSPSLLSSKGALKYGLEEGSRSNQRKRLSVPGLISLEKGQFSKDIRGLQNHLGHAVAWREGIRAD